MKEPDRLIVDGVVLAERAPAWDDDWWLNVCIAAKRKGRAICGSRKRDDTPCELAPSKGRVRCRFHGGAALRGSEHPLYKGRGWSRSLPDRWASRVAEAVDDPELTSLRWEMALLDERINELFGQLWGGDTPPLESIGTHLADLSAELHKTEPDIEESLRLCEEAVSVFRGNTEVDKKGGDALARRKRRDEKVWEQIQSLLETRRRLNAVENRKEAFEQANLTTSQIVALVGSIKIAMDEEVKNTEERRRLGQRLEGILLGQGTTMKELVEGS